METGRKILNLRTAQGFNRAEFARACGLDVKLLAGLEKGHARKFGHPCLAVFRLARHLGVTVEYLLDEGQPYPPPRPAAYREGLSHEGRHALTRATVTLEERAFLSALRTVHKNVRDLTFAIPELPLEVLSAVHRVVMRGVPGSSTKRKTTAGGASQQDRS